MPGDTSHRVAAATSILRRLLRWLPPWAPRGPDQSFSQLSTNFVKSLTFKLRRSAASLSLSTLLLLLFPAFDASAQEFGFGAEVDRVVVTSKLDEDRDQIVPSLGATEYRIGDSQIGEQSMGSNASFNQVILRAPGVVQDSFGQLHVRGEHANLQYRINDVLLPEGISGFGQELDVGKSRNGGWHQTTNRTAIQVSEDGLPATISTRETA